MKQIELTQDKWVLVDNEDYDYLNQFYWSVTDDNYAQRSIIDNNKKIIILMHREILGLKPGDGKIGDHKDLNPLNNQRYNLRICTRLENNRNRTKNKNGKSSQYKGVSWNKTIKKYVANCNHQHIGCFEHEIDAAKAYNDTAKIIHGEFASLNTIPQ